MKRQHSHRADVAITVTGVNDAGEGQPSAPVSATVT